MDLMALWGKTVRVDGAVSAVHPLLCHMIDVAEVTGVLWERALGDGMRKDLVETLGCSQEDSQRTLMFWAALHDLGKASPPFQRRYPAAVPILERQGLCFRREFGASDERAWHGTITAATLGRLLEDCGWSRDLARDVARGLGGHHGAWPTSGEIRDLSPDHLGGATWDQARSLILDTLAQQYRPRIQPNAIMDRACRQAFVALLSGLVSVADWLGSMEEHFPAEPHVRDPAEYRPLATGRAARAVAAEGWGRWQAPATGAIFDALFPGWRPNDMQRRVFELAPALEGPALVLIEAPTGSGKTEAALHLADTLAARQQQRGLYVAMPTTATSNAMHARLLAMLSHRYGEGAVQPLLVHGQAMWRQAPPAVSSEHEADSVRGLEEMSWFLPRKRSLLAPFGVGTVDQALLSVLLTRHFFVRLFGLAHKTVIFDEVHAYDTYMNTLFCRLLAWLRAQGTSVILLSATLPEATRRTLFAAWGSSAAEAQAGYPQISWACGERQGTEPIEAPADTNVHLGRLDRSSEALVQALRQGLAGGGCAAVLCNTVGRAQEVYRLLKEAAVVPEEDLILFHARFPLAWRDEIEQRVLERYGKESQPEQRRGIVVATQVIEQSLDLDFDLMVSDLAPLDLLLQRAGRLHRHERERPAGLAEPRLLLVEPERGAEDLPAWGNDGYVYEPYILLRTWLVLQGRDALHLPSETRELIEAVYGPEMTAADGVLSDAMQDYRDQWQATMRREQAEAAKRLVLGPESFRLFGQENQGLVEEDPALNAAFQALTRWGRPGLTIILLEERDGLLHPACGGEAVDWDREPDAATVRQLVASSLSVTHPALVSTLGGQPLPPGWRSHSLLRYQCPLILHNGVCEVVGTGLSVALSPETGLEVQRNPGA